MDVYDVYLYGTNPVKMMGFPGQEALGEFSSLDLAVQAACGLLGELGGKVMVARGQYAVSSPCVVTGNVTLCGAGQGTVVRVMNPGGTGILACGADHVAVSELCVVSEAGGGIGVCLDGCGDSRVHRVTAAGFDVGISMQNLCFLCEVNLCSLAGNHRAGVLVDGLSADGRGGDFVPSRVSNCTIYRGGYGILVTNSIVINVSDCQIFQTEKDGIRFEKISNSGLISGCRTFQIKGQAVSVEETHEMNISSNIFCWTRGHGIQLRRASWATITGNNVIDVGVRAEDGTLKDCIRLEDASRGVQVTGNALFNWGDQIPMYRGIYEEESCYHNIFTANNINYFEGEPLELHGQNSVCENNLSQKYPAYENQSEEDYHGFDYTVERYITEGPDRGPGNHLAMQFATSRMDGIVEKLMRRR